MLSNPQTRMLVDTGEKHDGRRLLKKLMHVGVPDAVIMTHTHFDHAGNAGILKEHFSPKFIVQESEKDFLESGDSPIPRGTRLLTRFVYHLGAEKKQHWFHVKGVKADIVFADKYDLNTFVFNGCVLHTPGHSDGSCCIVLENEIALAGDTMTGIIPGSAFPPWGNDSAAIIRGWNKLLDSGCHTFLPAHGFAISRQRLEREYRKRKPS
jgi:glyoxylase-like metal-dependent hydrolase (beta-lactamase superfamily II)